VARALTWQALQVEKSCEFMISHRTQSANNAQPSSKNFRRSSQFKLVNHIQSCREFVFLIGKQMEAGEKILTLSPQIEKLVTAVDVHGLISLTFQLLAP
jgi:hypothetical protein